MRLSANLIFRRLLDGGLSCRWLVSFFLAVWGGGAALHVQADIIQKQFAMPILVEFDTNPTMAPVAKSLWRSALSPRYGLSYNNDVGQWYANGTLRIERTSDQTVSINREDPALDAGWKRQMATGEYGVSFHYDEVSSRTSQLDETGSVGGDNTRITKSIALVWQKYLNEKLSLALNAATSRMTFDGGGINSRTYNGSVMLGYSWNEKNEPYVRFATNRYAPDGDSDPTDFYSGVAGFKWVSSQYLSGDVNAGLNRIYGVTQDTGWQAEAKIVYAAEKSSLTLGLSRSLSPAGNGGFLESEQAKAGFQYVLSDRSRAGLDVALRRNRDANASETRQAGAWYARELSPFWNLRASLQHRESSNNIQNASGNVLGLSLVFSLPDF